MRGGANRKQGRKPLTEGEKTVLVSMRLSISQRVKFKALGGGKWARAKIDEEPDGA